MVATVLFGSTGIKRTLRIFERLARTSEISGHFLNMFVIFFCTNSQCERGSFTSVTIKILEIDEFFFISNGCN